jgi:hypothetical protein
MKDYIKYIKTYEHWELVVNELESAYLAFTGKFYNVGEHYVMRALAAERTALFKAFPEYASIWVKKANNAA